MYCKKCGKEIDDEAVVCPNCGCATENYKQEKSDLQAVEEKDSFSVAITMVGFFFMVVGLILFLIWKNKMPLRAKSAGTGALIRVIADILLTIILVVVMLELSASSRFVGNLY